MSAHQDWLEAPYRAAWLGRPSGEATLTVERPVPSTSGEPDDGWCLLEVVASVADGAVEGSDVPLTDAEEAEAVERAELAAADDAQWSDDFSKEEAW